MEDNNKTKKACSCICISSLVEELIECATRTTILPSTSLQPDVNAVEEPHTSNQHNVVITQPGGKNSYQIYRALGSFVDDGNLKITKSLSKTPPSYSTVIRLGPSERQAGINIHPSIPFISRDPPPSYAEVAGVFEDNLSNISSETIIFGPDPLYVVCPRCSAIVITQTHSRRTIITYLSSLVLCLCLCWPCCLFPLFTNTCKETFHTCPNCNYYFGMYRPW